MSIWQLRKLKLTFLRTCGHCRLTWTRSEPKFSLLQGSFKTISCPSHYHLVAFTAVSHVYCHSSVMYVTLNCVSLWPKEGYKHTENRVGASLLLKNELSSTPFWKGAELFEKPGLALENTFCNQKYKLSLFCGLWTRPHFQKRHSSSSFSVQVSLRPASHAGWVGANARGYAQKMRRCLEFASWTFSVADGESNKPDLHSPGLWAGLESRGRSREGQGRLH